MCKTIAIGSVVFMAASVLYAPAASAEDKPKGIVYINPETKRLESLYGLWIVTERHFDDRGQVVGTVKGQEEVEWILDDHAIRRNYRTGAKPAVYEAMGLLSWNTGLKQYRGVWIDNHSTAGPTMVTGEWKQENETFVFHLESIGADGKTLRFRVVEKLMDDETRLSTTYAVDGDKVTKRLEVQYKKAPPCPDQFRKLAPFVQ